MATRRKLSPAGTAGATGGQNKLNSCRMRPFGLYGELKSETQSGNSGLVANCALCEMNRDFRFFGLIYGKHVV